MAALIFLIGDVVLQKRQKTDSVAHAYFSPGLNPLQHSFYLHLHNARLLETY